MPLIDYTYFVGQINIPNVDKPATLQALDTFIAENENDTMCNLLGYELFKAFQTEIATQTQRMVDLRDGVEYSYGGRLYKWRGLKFLQNNTKYSLLAYYIYFMYMQNKATNTSGTGENVATTENSVAHNSIDKQVYAHNQFVRHSADLYQFLNAKYNLYPEWQGNYWREVKTINSLGI